MGPLIRSRTEKPMSIASFAKVRFGNAMNVYVTANVLLNLSVAMSVEYTAIGALFKEHLSTPEWIPITVVGFVTMAYTIAGGLYISILTDQIQSIFIILLISCVAIYLSATFRHSLGPLPEQIGVDSSMGWSSIATIGLGLTSSAIFSDSVWQRVWSAKDANALLIGSSVGMVFTSLVTLLFAFAGFLAGWAGLIDFSNPDAINAGFFAVLKNDSGEVPTAVLCIVCLLATVLNESAVDSFQNAILDTIVSFFVSLGFKIPLNVARFTIILLNVPIMILGAQGLPIINLYLTTNMLTTASVVPLCMGLFPSCDYYVSG